MAGAWEIRKQTSVLGYTIHTDLTSIAWAFGLRALQIPGRFTAIAGMPYDHARNTACQACLDGGYEWLFSLDSDVIAPPDAVLRLLAHRQPIVSGVYHRRSPPAGIPVMMKPVGCWLTQYPPNKVIEVDVVGAGCFLVHRSVLEKMARHPQRPGKMWFDWRVDLKGHYGLHDMECLSEDFTFCTHAKKLGYQILVDTGVQCKHAGLFEVVYGNARPLEIAA